MKQQDDAWNQQVDVLEEKLAAAHEAKAHGGGAEKPKSRPRPLGQGKKPKSKKK